MRYEQLPLGTDHPVDIKIEWAHRLYRKYGREILASTAMKEALARYKSAIQATWKAMDETGISRECGRCATEDGGSCCAKGIENRFDLFILLLNLLMDREIPARRWDPEGCRFLGPQGCKLLARHVICINFICKRLYSRIPQRDIQRVQQAMEEETTLAFLLEEAVKKWLIKRLQQDSDEI